MSHCDSANQEVSYELSNNMFNPFHMLTHDQGTILCRMRSLFVVSIPSELLISFLYQKILLVIHFSSSKFYAKSSSPCVERHQTVLCVNKAENNFFMAYTRVTCIISNSWLHDILKDLNEEGVSLLPPHSTSPSDLLNSHEIHLFDRRRCMSLKNLQPSFGSFHSGPQEDIKFTSK